MIGTKAFISIALMIALGVIFPVSVAIWWIRTSYGECFSLYCDAV